jgi:hypothetical protein
MDTQADSVRMYKVGLAFELSEFVHKCKPIQGTNTDAQIFNHKQAIQPSCAFSRVLRFPEKKMRKQTSNCYERQRTNRVENRTNFSEVLRSVE